MKGKEFSYCQVTTVKDYVQTRYGDARIKLMAEHLCRQDVLFRDVYFEGGNVLRCYRGRFRFTLGERAPVVIGENETIVVYPDQRVTIESLDKVNLLVYVVFEGNGVSAYFDQFGFFNGIHGETSAQLEIFCEIKRVLESSEEHDHSQLMLRLSDALSTYAHDLCVGSNAVVCEAIRQIRENLTNKIVRLMPLYEQMRIGHTSLNEAFRKSGIGSPAKFIRQELFRHIKFLLQNTQKTIAEISKDTGFISTTHFANFVRRNSGKTASEFRRAGKIMIFGNKKCVSGK